MNLFVRPSSSVHPLSMQFSLSFRKHAGPTGQHTNPHQPTKRIVVHHHSQHKNPKMSQKNSDRNRTNRRRMKFILNPLNSNNLRFFHTRKSFFPLKFQVNKSSNPFIILVLLRLSALWLCLPGWIWVRRNVSFVVWISPLMCFGS